MSLILHGTAASRGIVVGTSLLYDRTPPTVEHRHIAPEQTRGEQERLQQALSASAEEVAQLRDQVQARIGSEEAAIFDAHLLILEDEALMDSTREHIESDLMNAEWALWEAAEEFAQLLGGLENTYFQARATDIYDIRNRIVNHLQGRSAAQLQYLHNPIILIARDLLPSDTAGLDPALILGLITEQGGPTSHTAILARQMGIPAVVGVHGLLDTLQSLQDRDVQVALDGGSGEIILAPDPETVQQYQQSAERYRQQQLQLQELQHLPAVTRDGATLELAANIGRSREAQPALEAGAGGVGLFRTEFLFLDRESAPSEDEQYQAYCEVLHIFAGKTVIIRTLDIGGDKSVPYLSLPHEDNPFLGVRGIRLCLAPAYQDLFRTQVRALLLAAATVPNTLWIMFPMICDLRELRQAKVFLRETEASLLQEGKLTNTVLPGIRVGIMIETPSSIWLIDQLAREADFFSIGTNDLSQYTLASDRMNANLEELHRPFHPAVLRSLAHAIRSARQQQRWIGMCGEMAGDPRITAFLLGLGINELSMEPKALNLVKQIIRTTTTKQAQELIDKVLELESSQQIEQLFQQSANHPL